MALAHGRRFTRIPATPEQILAEIRTWNEERVERVLTDLGWDVEGSLGEKQEAVVQELLERVPDSRPTLRHLRDL